VHAVTRWTTPSVVMKNTRPYILLTAGLLTLTAPFWVTWLVWERAPWNDVRVQLVDYTVPYKSGREHRGAAWVLNHEKYRPPEGKRWERIGTHVGYQPGDRSNPTSISAVDLSQTDWIYVTDSYGVYEDDLKEIDRQRAHMDYSKRIFGGLSVADADAIARHTARGRHVFLEFNALEEPTEPEARETLQDLLGVEWTGWTGRVFADLYDTLDVPHWLPRLHKQQYGTDSMPKGPHLALVHKDGRLFLLGGRLRLDVAPRLAITAEGREAIPVSRGGAPYYYWFPVLTVRPGTELLSELVLPQLPGLQAMLAKTGIPARLPMLTRRTDGGAHRIYLAADLADTDFDPGVYSFAGIARLRTASENSPFQFDTQNAFWQFYVPTVRELLRAPFEGMQYRVASTHP
jgi:hypothetical protein